MYTHSTAPHFRHHHTAPPRSTSAPSIAPHSCTITQQHHLSSTTAPPTAAPLLAPHRHYNWNHTGTTRPPPRQGKAPQSPPGTPAPAPATNTIVKRLHNFTNLLSEGPPASGTCLWLAGMLSGSARALASIHPPSHAAFWPSGNQFLYYSAKNALMLKNQAISMQLEHLVAVLRAWQVLNFLHTTTHLVHLS